MRRHVITGKAVVVGPGWTDLPGHHVTLVTMRVIRLMPQEVQICEMTLCGEMLMKRDFKESRSQQEEKQTPSFSSDAPGRMAKTGYFLPVS